MRTAVVVISVMAVLIIAWMIFIILSQSRRRGNRG